MDERLERHLCNLHNEVFEAAESRINTECSLTIREGISIFFTTRRTSNFVPSLYVRVYRRQRKSLFYQMGSLTIREGISPKQIPANLLKLFPHYT